jgi:hypothetical protein
LIASWILDRFGAAPETEAIAGDLLEQYALGRSRLWYWREVMVAIFRGTWSEVQQHRLSMVTAVALAWGLNFVVWQKVATPLEYWLIVRLIGRHVRLEEISFLSLMIDGPRALAMGWTTAQFARRCRIPAVFGTAGVGLLVGCWTIWENSQTAGPHFSVLPALWLLPLLTALVLLGGGLLTGAAKRSMRA